MSGEGTFIFNRIDKKLYRLICISFAWMREGLQKSWWRLRGVAGSRRWRCCLQRDLAKEVNHRRSQFTRTRKQLARNLRSPRERQAIGTERESAWTVFHREEDNRSSRFPLHARPERGIARSKEIYTCATTT